MQECSSRQGEDLHSFISQPLVQEKWASFNQLQWRFCRAGTCLYLQWIPSMLPLLVWATAPPRAGSGQKRWDVALQTGLVSQPCSNTAKGTNNPTVSSPALLGAVAFLAWMFSGRSTRAPGVLQMCSLLTVVSSRSATTWPRPLGIHGCCLVPLWHKQTTTDPEGSTLTLPVQVSNLWVLHVVRVTASSCSSPVGKKGNKIKFLNYTQIPTSEIMFFW